MSSRPFSSPEAAVGPHRSEAPRLSGAVRARLAAALREFDTARLLLLLACIVLFTLSLYSSTDPDYWWHLRTGRLIIQERSVPTVDPFSYTAEGKRWVAHEWLGEVLIYGVQQAGGYAANLVLFTALAMASLLIAYRIALSFGVSRWVATGLFFWAGVISTPYWNVRPQVLSWLLLAVFLAVLVEHRGGRNRLWLLPPLMALWANLHLGYAFGLGVVGLYALAVLAERSIWKTGADVKWPLLALAGCVAATALTPNPLEVLVYPLDYVRPGNFGVSFIAEWQSPNFHDRGHWALGLGILMFAAIGVFGRRRDLFLPGLALSFTWLALHAARNQPLFAVVFLVVTAAVMAERWQWASAAFSSGRSARERPWRNAALGLAAIVLAVAYVDGSSGNQLHRNAEAEGGIYYPKAGAEFIRTNYPEARIFNVYHWGGYLIYELYPRKVFIDGRSDFYGDAILQSYNDVAMLRPNWQQVLDSYGVDLVLIQKDAPLSQGLAAAPDTWRLVFTGVREVIYVRETLAGQLP